jgi:hypothetical protein
VSFPLAGDGTLVIQQFAAPGNPALALSSHDRSR